MTSWQNIETCPKIEGNNYLVRWANGNVSYLMWKENSRIVHAHRQGEWDELREKYFGDQIESDDYELAKSENFPLWWLPIPEMPK